MGIPQTIHSYLFTTAILDGDKISLLSVRVCENDVMPYEMDEYSQ